MRTSFFSRSTVPWGKAWGIVYTIGLTLRLWQIATPALWYDEQLQRWVSSLPFRQMLAAVGADVHPPLHYLITWTLMHLGLTDALWLRLPSVVFGMLAIWLVRQLAERWDLSPAAAWTAGLLMAVLPMQLNYSQEARVYALLQVLYLWALLTLTGRPLWVQFVIASGLMLWAHNFGFVYGLTLAPLAAARLWGEATELSVPAVRNWIMRCLSIGLALLLIYAPWISTLAGQVTEQAVGWWKTPATIGQVLYVYYWLFWWTGLQGGYAALGAFVTFGLLALGVVQAVRTRLRTGPVLLYLAAAPVLIALVIEAVYRPILLHRALIGVAAPLYLLAAHALDTLPQYRRLAWGLLAPVLVLGAVAFTPMRVQANGGQLFDGAQSFAYIAAHAEPGDLVIHGNAATLVEGWGKLPGLEQALMPVQPGSKGVPSETFWRSLGVRIVDPASAPGRVWLVWSAGPTIAAAEDAVIADLTAGVPPVWTGSTPVAKAGLWLLTPQTSTAR